MSFMWKLALVVLLFIPTCDGFGKLGPSVASRTITLAEQAYTDWGSR
jgi:hypothetical protein